MLHDSAGNTVEASMPGLASYHQHLQLTSSQVANVEQPGGEDRPITEVVATQPGIVQDALGNIARPLAAEPHHAGEE